MTVADHNCSVLDAGSCVGLAAGGTGTVLAIGHRHAGIDVDIGHIERKLLTENIRTKLRQTVAYCRSPDLKSPIGSTNNLERLYNQVVVCSLFVCCLQHWL